jgi:hypothetical protein
MPRMVGAAAREPAAVLVVSAWHEGEPPRLAARITYSLDVAREDRVTVTAAGVDEIATIVQRWLHQVAAVRAAGDAPVTEE